MKLLTYWLVVVFVVVVVVVVVTINLYLCNLLIHVVSMIIVRSVLYHLCQKTLNKIYFKKEEERKSPERYRWEMNPDPRRWGSGRYTNATLSPSVPACI